MLSINVECSNNSILVDYACILKLLKFETTNSQKTSCQTCLTASFLVTGGFRRIISQNSMIFPWLFRFLKFHGFSMHGIYFSDFPGFPWFPELVGTLMFILATDWCGVNGCFYMQGLELVYNDIVIHVLGIYVSNKKNFKDLTIIIFLFIWPIYAME